MFVCICNALSDSDCAAAACRPECRTVACLYRHFGCQVRCGKCVPMMTRLFRDARAKALAGGASPEGATGAAG